MRRILQDGSRRVGQILTAAVLSATLLGGLAWGQGYPMGGGGGMGGMPGSRGGIRPSGRPEDTAAPKPPEKSEKEAKKFFAAGMKSLTKAHTYEDEMAKAPNEDK